MQEFYLTTASNASTEYFPENTVTNFTTRLSKVVELDQNWVVGLAEKHYPKSWANVTEGENRIIVTRNGVTRAINIEPGYYSSPTQIVQAFKDGFKKVVLNSVAVDENYKFKYSGLTLKLTVEIGHLCELYLPPALHTLLGFGREQVLNAGIHESQYHIDMNLGFSGIYLYCDVLNFSHVGNITAPLLGIIGTKGKHNVTVTHRFNLIHYKTLRIFNFQNLNFLLTSDYGRKIPFQGGKIMLTLHFKRVPRVLL